MISSTPALFGERTYLVFVDEALLLGVCFSRSIFFIREPVINGDISTSWPLKWGTQTFSVMQMLPLMYLSMLSWRNYFLDFFRGSVIDRRVCRLHVKDLQYFHLPGVLDSSLCVRGEPMHPVQSTSWVCKSGFMRTQPCPFFYVLSRCAVGLQWQS